MEVVMANYMAGSTNGIFPVLPKNPFETDHIEVFSVLLNNSCNLSCKHCYLQTDRFEPYMTANDWSKWFRSVLGANKPPGVITFVGKEVCLNAKTLDVVLQTVKQRNAIQGPNGHTQIGMITNGTLLHKHTQKLLETPPDYVDISIDGLPEQHNAVRGAGAYEQLAPNLKWLTQHFPNPIWAIHTLFENNIKDLPNFLEFYQNRYDITNYSIGFYKPFYYTDEALRILRKQYIDFADNILPSLANLSFNKPVKITMELDIMLTELTDIMAERGWVHPTADIATANRSFDNGLTIQINSARIPTGLWRSIRLTPEGYYLRAEDIINVRQYKERMIGSIKAVDYDYHALYEAGIKRWKEDTTIQFT